MEPNSPFLTALSLELILFFPLNHFYSSVLFSKGLMSSIPFFLYGFGTFLLCSRFFFPPETKRMLLVSTFVICKFYFQRLLNFFKKGEIFKF